MVAHPQRIELKRRLAEVQAATRAHRTAVFVDYAPTVCGIVLRPVTFRSHAHLLAFRNAFVAGGPVDFRHLVQFVWLHHPEFGQFAHAARRRVTRQLWRALHPRAAALNAVVRFLAPLPRFRWLRGLCRPTAVERFDAALAEVRRIVREAHADFPAPGDDGEPLPFALEPHLVSLLMRGYELPFDRAFELLATMPLKQLVEFIRETLHRLSKGKDKLLTTEEAAIWVEWLGQEEAPAPEKSAIGNRPSEI